jgi:hypothetical protein
LFTIISFNDEIFPIHIEVKLAAPPAVRQPSVVSFHLPHDTTLGCSFLAPPISAKTPGASPLPPPVALMNLG